MTDLTIGGDKARKPITVTLVGEEYRVLPPKSTIALAMAKKVQGLKAEDIDPMLEVLRDWLALAVGSKDRDAIMKRTEDPEDALDIMHVMELLRKVTEYTTGGNPTT